MPGREGRGEAVDEELAFPPTVKKRLLIGTKGTGKTTELYGLLGSLPANRIGVYFWRRESPRASRLPSPPTWSPKRWDRRLPAGLPHLRRGSARWSSDSWIRGRMTPPPPRPTASPSRARSGPTTSASPPRASQDPRFAR